MEVTYLEDLHCKWRSNPDKYREEVWNQLITIARYSTGKLLRSKKRSKPYLKEMEELRDFETRLFEYLYKIWSTKISHEASSAMIFQYLKLNVKYFFLEEERRIQKFLNKKRVLGRKLVTKDYSSLQSKYPTPDLITIDSNPRLQDLKEAIIEYTIKN